MGCKILTVYYPDGKRRLFRLSQLADGSIERICDVPQLDPALTHWINHGLCELVKQEDGHHVSRLTPSSHPEFLERLGEDSERQFRFKWTLIEEQECSGEADEAAEQKKLREGIDQAYAEERSALDFLQDDDGQT